MKIIEEYYLHLIILFLCPKCILKWFKSSLKSFWIEKWGAISYHNFYLSNSVCYKNIEKSKIKLFYVDDIYLIFIWYYIFEKLCEKFSLIVISKILYSTLFNITESFKLLKQEKKS
jgi:hypothetical protein